jgi:hypothetical protein
LWLTHDYHINMPALLIGQAGINLTEMVLGMIGAGGFSLFIGCFLVRQAWGNLREGRVPLVGSVQLTGIAGRLGAMLLLVAGLAAIVSGAGIVVFILWRIAVVLNGG